MAIGERLRKRVRESLTEINKKKKRYIPMRTAAAMMMRNDDILTRGGGKNPPKTDCNHFALPPLLLLEGKETGCLKKIRNEH